MDCHRIVGVIQTDGKKVCIEREGEREMWRYQDQDDYCLIKVTDLSRLLEKNDFL